MHDLEGITPPAELFLRDQGLVTRASPSREAMLWCIGCRILTNEEAGAEPVVYATQIQKCTGIASGTVTPGMLRLEETGVLVSDLEQENAVTLGRPLRRLYSTAPTELGQAFKDTLRQPPGCPLRGRRESSDPEPDDIVGEAVGIRRQKMVAEEMALALGFKLVSYWSLRKAADIVLVYS